MARSQVFSRAIHSRIGMDLSGWWSFENNALDRSGWGNDGTMHNFPANPWEPGVFGSALRFDGVDDFVNVPHSASLNMTDMITIEAWINPRPHHTAIGIVGKEYGVGITNYAFYVRSNHSLLFEFHNITWRTHATPALIVRDTWQHVAVTFSLADTRVRMFINGSEVYSGVETTALLPNTRNLFVGSLIHDGFSFHGLIDEPRIYRAAMPISYIQKRYVQGIKGLAMSGGITQEEKNERIAQLRNSDQLAIDLDAALAGNIDFSQYTKYLVFEK